MRKEAWIRRGTQTESKASEQSADTWYVVQPAQIFTSKPSSMTPMQYVKAASVAYDLYRYLGELGGDAESFVEKLRYLTGDETLSGKDISSEIHVAFQEERPTCDIIRLQFTRKSGEQFQVNIYTASSDADAFQETIASLRIASKSGAPDAPRVGDALPRENGKSAYFVADYRGG